MTEPIGGDPLDELRRADPVDHERLPSASLARVRARVQEATAMEERNDDRRARARLALGAVTVAVASLALVIVLGPRGVTPGSSPTPSEGAPVIGACVEQYSPAALANRDFAFDGTVTAIDGDEVTFRVNESFRGAESGKITLTAEGMTGTTITSAGGTTLTVGERYLVAGDDRFVWSCGFTREYDAATAAEWKAALGA